MSLADGTPIIPLPAPTLLSAATLSALQPVLYPPATILFREHDADNRVYVVLSGQVALVSAIGTENEQIIALHGPGQVLGTMSFFYPNHQRVMSARAELAAEVLVLDRDILDNILQREPLLAYELLRAASTYLNRAQERSIHALEEKNTQLTEAYLALEQAQARLVEQERVEHELRLAREIQEGMLPATMPNVPGIDIAVRSLPAHEMGGDFVDVFVLDDETLGLVIGDVVEKGMPSALYMAQTRTLIRSEARQSASPETVLQRVNTALQELNQGSMFVTVLFARLEHKTRRLITARAGHEYPLFWNKARSVPTEMALGQPLGLLPEPAIDVQGYTLQPGDSLVMYTDGVTDATSVTGDFFGLDGLQVALHSAGTQTAQELCDHIVQHIAVFRGIAPQPDDITLVVVQVA